MSSAKTSAGAGVQILAPLVHGVLTASFKNPDLISPTEGPLTPPFPPNHAVDTLNTTEAANGNIPLSGFQIKKSRDEWLLDFKVWQKFAINVHPAAGDRRLGHTVGLVQTLSSSTRKITYAGGGARFIPGGQPAPGKPEKVDGPWLDADQMTTEGRPWYRETCAGKVMEAGHTETFVMEDNPTFNVPTVAYDKAKKPHALEGVSVKEVFLISLYDAEDLQSIKAEKVGSPQLTQSVIEQWTWQYEYGVTVTPTEPLGYRLTPPAPITTKAIPVTTIKQDIPLSGNVANENPPWFKFDDPTWTRYID